MQDGSQVLFKAEGKDTNRRQRSKRGKKNCTGIRVGKKRRGESVKTGRGLGEKARKRGDCPQEKGNNQVCNKADEKGRTRRFKRKEGNGEETIKKGSKKKGLVRRGREVAAVKF